MRAFLLLFVYILRWFTNDERQYKFGYITHNTINYN